MIRRVEKLSGRPFATAEERLQEIAQAVREERRVKPERNAILGTMLGNFSHDKAVPVFKGLDAMYKVTDACAGRGTCATWSPKPAIGFGRNVEPSRAHAQGVSVQDFYLR